MRLNQLLEGVDIREIVGPTENEVELLTMDSREARKGALFAAIRGTVVDGHRFIHSATEKGADVVICEELPTEIEPNVSYVVVDNSSHALGWIAANFYGRPSEQLMLVGVTGTNGKTTTATLLYELTEKLGYKAGLISTVVYKVGSRSIHSTHTTPDAITLNRLLAEMVSEGCGYCFMEVSSHSLVQHRTTGLSFKGALFSNLTHDHLDDHKTFGE